MGLDGELHAAATVPHRIADQLAGEKRSALQPRLVPEAPPLPPPSLRAVPHGVHRCWEAAGQFWACPHLVPTGVLHVRSIGRSMGRLVPVSTGGHKPTVVDGSRPRDLLIRFLVPIHRVAIAMTLLGRSVAGLTPAGGALQLKEGVVPGSGRQARPDCDR